MTNFAFVFPGQGSQSRGMMNGYADIKVVRDTFEEASDILKKDLWKLIAEGTDAYLSITENTQPKMLAAGVAVYRAWQALGGRPPTIMAGHSLGEYTALVAAGALRFSDALPLVVFRAQCMQKAVPEGEGGMAAILGLDDSAVRDICVEAAQGSVLEAANYNSPGQVVIGGNHAAVERGMLLAKNRGAKRAIMLPISVPSHCSLLTGAAEQLRTYLDKIPMQKPAIPVVNNADVKCYSDETSIKNALVRQLYSPVRWVETVLEFGTRGVTCNVECGPGKVLVGMNKRIDIKQKALTLNDGEGLKQALAMLA